MLHVSEFYQFVIFLFYVAVLPIPKTHQNCLIFMIPSFTFHRITGLDVITKFFFKQSCNQLLCILV